MYEGPSALITAFARGSNRNLETEIKRLVIVVRSDDDILGDQRALGLARYFRVQPNVLSQPNKRFPTATASAVLAQKMHTPLFFNPF